MAASNSRAVSGDHVMAGSALVIAVGSLLNFFEIDIGDITGDDDEFAELGAALFGVFDTSWSGWSNAWSLFPLVTLSVLATLAVGVLAVMRRSSSVEVPERVGGVSVQGLSVLVAGFAVVSVAAHILRSLLATGEDDGALSVGPGGWILLVGMIGLLVGASLSTSARHTEVPDPTAGDDDRRDEPDPRPEGTWVLLGAGTLTLVGSFLPVLGASGTFGDLDDSGGAEHAWTSGLRPVFGLPAVAGVVVIALVIAANTNRPVGLRRFGITAADLKLAISAYGVFASFALLIGNPVFGSFSGLVEAKVGHYLMLVGTIALVAGCLVERTTPPSAAAEAP